MNQIALEFDRPERSAAKAARELDKARALFAKGRLHAAADSLAQVDAATARRIGAEATRDFLLFGLAAYHCGDLAEARRRHAAAPPGRDAALRYRMLIALREPLLAKRLRKSAKFGQAVETDFRWTHAREALWSGHIGRGLRGYHARIGAAHFTKILPRWLRHDPKMAEVAAPEAVVLEQGVGDTFFHIGQMLRLGAAPRQIYGQARHRALIAALWPGAEFHDLADGPDGGAPRPVACSGDWLLARWRREGTLGGLAPLPPFQRPTPPHARAGIGVCWRGGSGQNRREEREIPLQFFLDLLPNGPGYVALQHDLTAEERAILATRPDIAVPDFGLTDDDLQTAEAVAKLSGVITVDSANAHFAGATGTPLLLIMNPRAHWFWGPDQRAEHVYHLAETVPMAALNRNRLCGWIKAQAPKCAPPAITAAATPGPIFITGAPRSRTSMIAGALAAGGLNLGQTIGPTPDNPNGFAENRRIRETVLKPLLSTAGFDPLGVTHLPPLDWAPPAPGLRSRVAEIMQPDDTAEEAVWGYKDPKLLLLWRRWAKAFPEALWVIVDRPEAAVAASCQRTGFMRRHAAHLDYWRHFARSYALRADELAFSAEVAAVRIASDHVAETHHFTDPARSRLAARGVDMDAAEAFLRKTAKPEAPGPI